MWNMAYTVIPWENSYRNCDCAPLYGSKQDCFQCVLITQTLVHSNITARIIC